MSTVPPAVGNPPATPAVQPNPAAASAMGGDKFFLLLAVFIGVVSGLLVVCFRVSIEWARFYLLGTALNPSGWRVLLAPAIAGLAVALLVNLAFPRVRGSGVNQTKAALYIYNGYIPFRTVIGKFLCSALAIGAGHSLGPEDPSLQIGAGIASALGRRLQLSREKLRLIAPVGAAAGLAAAFNAPISAVLFVIEEVIGRWSAGVLGAVVLSAVSAAVIEGYFLGAAPLFHIPTLQPIRPEELLAYAALGVAGGFASLVFARLIAIFRPALKAAPRWTQFLQPAAAGLLIGLIGYFGAPQVMGAGYEYVDQALHDQFTWQILGMLAGLKILSTTISFVSGTPGGMFAPTLFIGAMLGGCVGGVEHMLVPHITASSPAAYALVGIGVLFAGFLRAPMTSVFMVLEVSHNYGIILPVIVSNPIAYLISRTFQPVPLFDMLSRQDGLDLPSMEEEREMAILRIEDAMQSPGLVLDGTQTVAEAVARAAAVKQDFYIVRRAPAGWSIVFPAELQKMASLGKGEYTLDSLLPRLTLPHLHPDHPLDHAMRFIHDAAVLPVVHRADFHRLEGVLTMDDILNAYQRFGHTHAAAPQMP